MTEQLVPVGGIVATHGLLGWLKVNPFNPETTVLTAGRQLIVEKEGQRTPHEIESSKQNKRQILIKLRGVDGIDNARKWVGATICVDPDVLEPLEPGQYYHYQVVGLEVYALSGERIGVITRVWSTPGGELYVVQGATKEFLIPAVKEIIEKVDFTAGRVIINPPEGLLDT
ncbi:MAG TPA: ribosome maturation factor RimM [Candidatus Binatia bacterium]|nr:ribosome maturation factor RimM [Candidatus Binatia bacterium]